MKRSKEEVMEDILEVCQEPASVTKIVYRVNLNFMTVKPHLERLLASNLLIEIHEDKRNLYKTTQKGMEALVHIKAFRTLFQPTDQEA